MKWFKKFIEWWKSSAQAEVTPHKPQTTECWKMAADGSFCHYTTGGMLVELGNSVWECNKCWRMTVECPVCKRQTWLIPVESTWHKLFCIMCNGAFDLNPPLYPDNK